MQDQDISAQNGGQQDGSIPAQNTPRQQPAQEDAPNRDVPLQEPATVQSTAPPPPPITQRPSAPLQTPPPTQSPPPIPTQETLDEYDDIAQTPVSSIQPVQTQSPVRPHQPSAPPQPSIQSQQPPVQPQQTPADKPVQPSYPGTKEIPRTPVETPESPQVIERQAAPETVRTQEQTETLRTQETEPVPEIQKPSETPQNEQQMKKTQHGKSLHTKGTNVIENVVDKTDEITTLHQIDQTRDKLTKIADEEEEEFIQRVEAAHGNQ